MAMFRLHSVFARAGSALTIAACGASVALLAASLGDAPKLAAAGERDLDDLDNDGLNDMLEHVLGTEPGSSDSDADGYSDLEEYARDSDPRSALVVPEAAEFAMRMGASQDGTDITMVATVYAEASKVGNLRLEFGVVYNGQVLRFAPRMYGPTSAFRAATSTTGARLTVLEFPLPVALVRRVGLVNMVSILRDVSATPSDPVVSSMPLVNFSGIVTTVEQVPAMLNATGSGRPAGIIYRPLAGDDQIPSTWNGGEICFQRTAAVGTNGVSIVHEVEAADCLPMDTYCSPVNCQAGVGRAIDLPDPAALAGG